MAKGMLSKHCLDAGWGSFLNILDWVATKRGVYFAKVDSRGTSQLCPVCDTCVSKDLRVRFSDCECGYRTNRDVASSQVVLKRGLAAVGQTVKKSVEGGEDTNPSNEAETSGSDSWKPTPYCVLAIGVERCHVKHMLTKQSLISTVRASMQRFKDCATASQMLKTNKLLVSGV